MADLAQLRESFALEDRADLLAAACRFGEASALMKAANAIRRREFGSGMGPNELRALSAQALGEGA